MQINFNYFNNRNTVLRPNEITQREGFLFLFTTDYRSFHKGEIATITYKDIFQNNWMLDNFTVLKGNDSSTKKYTN